MRAAAPVLVASLALVALTGCIAPPAVAPESSATPSRDSEASEMLTPDPAEPTADLSGVELNERGNLVVGVGETGTILSASGEPAIELTLTDYALEAGQSVECTAVTAAEPRKTYGVFAFDAVALPGYAEVAPLPLDVSGAQRFDYVDPATNLQVMVTGLGYLCLDSAEHVPLLSAGDEGRGYVVLDVDPETQAIVYDEGDIAYGLEFQLD